MKVLEGVRVIELAIYGQGPVAGGFLGDLGAEVIKIEHPITGDAMRGNIKQWGTERRVELKGGGIFHLDFAILILVIFEADSDEKVGDADNVIVF